MKKSISLLLSLMLATATMQAQQYLRVWQGEESQRIALTDAASMTFSAGSIQIGGTNYALTALDSITIVKTVFVQWNGASATVTVPTAAQKDIQVTQNGGDVVITNTNTTEEMEFVLSGESQNGSLTYNGAYKCKFHLNGLNLTSTTGAALDIQCGKRIDLILAEGSENSLTDAKTGSQKAALYSKGHLELAGTGTLSVTGNCRHAVATKEYLLLKKNFGTLNILAAASDALHVGQYFQMNGGTINIDKNTMGDGIQVEATNDAADELNGQLIVKGGKIDITISQEDCKGMKTGASDNGTVPAGNITITGGDITILAQGNGSRGIQTAANMTISDSDATTTIHITAAGSKCTQAACADDPHRSMGIKVDGTLTVTGGTTTVKNPGKGSRGIKVGNYVKKGGTVSGEMA